MLTSKNIFIINSYGTRDNIILIFCFLPRRKTGLCGFFSYSVLFCCKIGFKTENSSCTRTSGLYETDYFLYIFHIFSMYQCVYTAFKQFQVFLCLPQSVCIVSIISVYFFYYKSIFKESFRCSPILQPLLQQKKLGVC